MKALATLEIIIILIVLVVTAFFVLSWLGLGINPLDWFKKNELKARFCAEVQERTSCHVLEVSTAGNLGIGTYTESLRIKKSEVGKGGSKEAATYGEICEYFGYKSYKFDECLVKLCGCRITSVK